MLNITVFPTKNRVQQSSQDQSKKLKVESLELILFKIITFDFQEV